MANGLVVLHIYIYITIITIIMIIVIHIISLCYPQFLLFTFPICFAQDALRSAERALQPAAPWELSSAQAPPMERFRPKMGLGSNKPGWFSKKNTGLIQHDLTINLQTWVIQQQFHKKFGIKSRKIGIKFYEINNTCGFRWISPIRWGFRSD